MDKFNYTTVYNILGKFSRDFRGLEMHETDVIEWIGDALSFMTIPSAMEEAVAFVEVKNHMIDKPRGLHYILHIAKSNDFHESEICPNLITEELFSDVIDSDCDDCPDEIKFLDECGVKLFGNEVRSNPRPYFDLQYEYDPFLQSQYYNEKYSPVLLSNHSFFNSIVCQDPRFADLYRNSNLYEEYSPQGEKIKFSFENGVVAISYLRQRMDDEGYPMIPDDNYARSAMTYYILWKIKEREAYLHREGSMQLALKAEQSWNDYIKKFKNKAKMPKSAAQYQNLANESRYLIPRHNKYYGYFGSLGHLENRPFNDPDQRNQRYR